MTEEADRESDALVEGREVDRVGDAKQDVSGDRSALLGFVLVLELHEVDEALESMPVCFV